MSGPDDSPAAGAPRRRQRRRAARAQGAPASAAATTTQATTAHATTTQATAPQPGTSEPPVTEPPAAAGPEPDTTEPARKRRGPRAAGTDRGLRDLVGAGHSQIGVSGALRARDVNRPTDEDLAEAERDVVIVRRNWKPAGPS